MVLSLPQLSFNTRSVSRIAPVAALVALLSSPVSAQELAAKPARVLNQSLAASVEAGQYLRRGDKGQAVRELQRALEELGFEISVDGDFGPKTEAVLKAFQRSRKLGQDGVLGPRTLAQLKATEDKGSSWTPVTKPETTKDKDGSEDALADAFGHDSKPNTPVKSFTTPPNAKTSIKEVKSRARQWALEAKARGNRTLVVAFEGLWSFSQGYADKIYAAQKALRAGQKPKSLGSARMSFVAKYLVGPQMAKHSQLDYLLLPETSESKDSSVALNTVLEWFKVHGRGLKLVVVGHSFGGHASLKLVHKLSKHKVPVAAMLTIDARARPGQYGDFKTTSNVKAAYNYFQKSLFLPGYEIKGAVNQKLKGVSHGSIPNAEAVRRRYKALLGS